MFLYVTVELIPKDIPSMVCTIYIRSDSIARITMIHFSVALEHSVFPYYGNPDH